MTHWTERTGWTIDELRKAVAADTGDPDPELYGVARGVIELPDEDMAIDVRLYWSEGLRRWTLDELDCSYYDAGVRFCTWDDRVARIRVYTDYQERFAEWDADAFRAALDAPKLPEPIATRGDDVTVYFDGKDGEFSIFYPDSLRFEAGPVGGYCDDDGNRIDDIESLEYEDAFGNDGCDSVSISLDVFRALFLLRDTYGDPA